MSLSRTVYSIFYEGCTAYAVGKLDAEGKKYFQAEKKIPTLALIEDHFNGTITLGAYTVLPGNVVRWAAWDIDASDIKKAREIAKKLSDFLTEHGIPHGIQFSGKRGYHIYVFFGEAISAEEVKKACEEIRSVLALQKNGDPAVEVFPKQGRLTDSNPLGNLLRLPLGAHPETKVITTFVGTEKWEEGEPVDPEQIFSAKTTLKDLQKAISEQDPFDSIVNLMAPYWGSGQRHKITLAFSGYLAHSGWVEDDAIAIIEAIHTLAPEGDVEDQTKAVLSTYKKFYNGEKIIGLTGLHESLPASVLSELSELVGKGQSSSILQVIDRKRLEKGPAFLKIRSAASTAISYFKEQGRLVRDDVDTYWLNYKTHQLITLDSQSWVRLTHNLLGINQAESFGRQTAESIRHYAYDAAKEVTVKRRSHWNGKEELINLGGPEIYVLCGDPERRRVMLNGEGDVLFKNAEDTLRVPNLLAVEDSAISPWQLLTNDVNYQAGENISATPIQQREMLKAYILSIFFAEVMPTRPILTFIADPGAGKTTTARRILWIVEGPSQNVLSLNQDKPDSLRASMAVHKFVVLDNLDDTKAAWLTDTLNRAATGSHTELRKLHTTNEMQKLLFDCYIAITSTKMPFSDEAVFSRILPIELAKMLAFQPESIVQSDIVNNFKGMWKGMLKDLDKVVYELNRIKEIEMPTETRLADFAVFCRRIQEADFLDGKELIEGLSTLSSRQKRMLEKASPFIEVLEIWIRSRPEDGSKWMPMNEVFSTLQRVASGRGLPWIWSNSQGLSSHISMLEDQLIRHFGMSKKTVRESGRDIQLYKFEKRTLPLQ